jgi:hypothetical protein
MIRPAVAAMYRRRGSLISWLHAIPPPAGTIDALSGGPIASIGGGIVDGVGEGNFGEVYQPPVALWAYFSNKSTSFAQMGYGAVDVGDAKLDFAVPYVQANGSALLLDTDPVAGTVATTPSLSDYNNGNFALLQNGATIVFDRFYIMGQTWQAKAVPTPITDLNVVVAYRVNISKVDGGV